MLVFTVYIDGDCPLCAREADLWRRLDRGRGRLALVDIAAPEFDPTPLGKTTADLMAEIHGRDAAGQIVTGMAVFRQAYAAVGWGWLLAPTGWPILRPMFDWGYRWFARHRLRLTGRRCDAHCTTPTSAAGESHDLPPHLPPRNSST